MRTRAVGHACLEIEARGLRIVTDPWWEGPAYTNQWYPWPAPRPDGLETRPIDYLYLSHGHEDHLHVPTLRALRPGATALVPELLSGPIADFLRKELGFAHVIELPHGRTVELRRGLKATCYVNLTDSLLVLESGGRVLVNANDALHASPPGVIDWFCREISERHGPIDQLYVGFAGASWYPNCLRTPGKDDRAVAAAREEHFSNQFVRIVEGLRPRVACAFAASFALVEPHNQSIGDLRFDLPTPDELYRRRHPASATQAHLLLPDDVVDFDVVRPGGHPRPTREQLAYDLEKGVLREAAERVAHLRPLPADLLRDLVRRLDVRLQETRGRVSATLAPFSLELRLRDDPGSALRIEVEPLRARAALGPPKAANALLELRAEILDAVLREPYGCESVIIGYGAIASLERPEDFERVVTLLRLLSPREPSWRGLAGELRRRPQRTLGALWRQRWPLGLALGSRLRLGAPVLPVAPLPVPDRRPRRAA